MTQNFIYFNDDYFVGKPLKKSDFFYVENGRVIPYALASDPYTQISRADIEKYYQQNYNEIKKRKKLIQDSQEYRFQINNTRLFIYELFGDDAVIKCNIHNALGDNLLESEEIYNIILTKYHSPNDCLKCNYLILNSKDETN